MSSKLLKQYVGVAKGFRRYWQIYGGWTALLTSPYFLAAVATTALAWPLWSREGWWDSSLSVLPNILSFSLGGFALFLALGDEQFRASIAGANCPGGDKASPFLSFAVTFLHFILLQVAALLAAILAKAWYMVPAPAWLSQANDAVRCVGWAVGFWLFIYSLYAAIAAVMAIFVMVRAFDGQRTILRAQKRPESSATNTP